MIGQDALGALPSVLAFFIVSVILFGCARHGEREPKRHIRFPGA
jgi:hypothetical protein